LLLSLMVAAPANAADTWPAPDGWDITPQRRGCTLVRLGALASETRFIWSLRHDDPDRKSDLVLQIRSRLPLDLEKSPIFLTLKLDGHDFTVPAEGLRDCFCLHAQFEANLPDALAVAFTRARQMQAMVKGNSLGNLTLDGSADALASLRECDARRDEHSVTGEGISR